MERTLTCKATLGINPGYNNINKEISKEDYIRIEKCIEESNKNNYFYISFVVYPCKVFYNKEWGCPDNGENCVILESTANPKFINDFNIWKSCCRKVLCDLKDEFKQSTLSVIFQEAEFEYIESSKT